QAEDAVRDVHVTGVQTCALPIYVEPFLVAEIVADRRQRLLGCLGNLAGGRSLETLCAKEFQCHLQQALSCHGSLGVAYGGVYRTDDFGIGHVERKKDGSMPG